MIYVTEQSTQINSEVNLNPLSNTNTKALLLTSNSTSSVRIYSKLLQTQPATYIQHI